MRVPDVGDAHAGEEIEVLAPPGIAHDRPARVAHDEGHGSVRRLADVPQEERAQILGHASSTSSRGPAGSASNVRSGASCPRGHPSGGRCICPGAQTRDTPSRRSAQASGAAPAETLVLNHFTLIDGTGKPPLADAAIVVTEGRIAWVGPSERLKAPAGAQTVDVTGKFVMPGVIDLHTHLAASVDLVQDPKLYTRETVELQLRQYASYGITSVVSSQCWWRSRAALSTSHSAGICPSGCAG